MIMFRLVRSAEEVRESKVAWPLTGKATALVVAATVATLVAAIVGIEVCHNDPECTARAWPESVFGPIDVFWRDDLEKVESGKRARGWCELQNSDVLMAEKANSYSNLCFCAVALLLLAVGTADAVREGSLFPVMRKKSPAFTATVQATSSKDLGRSMNWRRNHIVTFPVLSLIFGLSVMFLGIGSFMMHAYPNRLTGQLDVGGTFIALSSPMWYTTLFFVDLNGEHLSKVRAILVLFVLVTDILLYMYTPELGAFALVGTIIPIPVLTGVSWLLRRKGKLSFSGQESTQFRAFAFFFLAGLALAIAFTIWILDRTGVWCDPTSFLQGHALWHFGCSLSLLFIYLFYRSEFILYSNEEEGSVPHEDDSALIESSCDQESGVFLHM